jgi:hypothetical protein
MKTIPGYSKYQISEDGKIYSLYRKRFLSPMRFGKYLRIKVKKDGDSAIKPKFIHYLVAITYIPNPLDLKYINHIDGTGDILNNHVSNLEWSTQKNNVIHAISNNLRKTFTLPVVQMDLNCNEIERFNSIIEAGNKTKVNPQTISDACNRKIKTSGGFYWRHADDIDWVPLVRKIKFKKIEKIDENGNVVEVIKNMDFLCKSQKCSWKAVTKAIKNNTSFRGFFWKYQTEEKVEPNQKINTDDWKIYEGYPKYKISNRGEIYSLSFQRLMRPKFSQVYKDKIICFRNDKGSKTFLIKKLVATLYVPNPENKKCIRYINGNKEDLYYKNLEWYSIDKVENPIIIQENISDGEIIQFSKNGSIIKIYKNIEEIKENTQFNTENILNICNRKGKFKLEGDHVWRFKNDSFEKVKNVKKILQLDMNTCEIINCFDTINDAKKFLNIGANSHIGDVCRGKRNVAHGFKWKYIEE